MNLNDIPREVWWVHMIKMQGFCGSSVYEKCKEIVAKYPEHFPDEVKYRKVPQEVHDAYHAETSYNSQSLTALLEMPPIANGDGVMSVIEANTRREPIKAEFTIKDFKDCMEMMAKHDRDEREAESKKEKLWNKHYAKYGLHYVKGKNIIT